MKGSVEAIIGVAALAVVLYLAYKIVLGQGAQNYVAAQNLIKSASFPVPIGAYSYTNWPANSALAPGAPIFLTPNTTIPEATALIPSVS